MEKSKKKLPKFYLGTRKPTSLGYLPNYGIGTGLFTSVKGEDITPEARAMRQNIVPGALSKLTLGISTPMLVLLDYKPAITTLGSSAAGAAGTMGLTTSSNLGTSATTGLAGNFGTPFGVGSTKYASTFLTGGQGSAIGGTAGSAAAETAGNAAENTAVTAGKTAASKVLGTAGTVVGALGTLYGLTDMGFLIANAGTHRTAADMRNTLTTNTYTTAGGNLYVEKGGVDTAAELEYERANTKSKQFNFGATAIGTGAAAGATIGALAGSSVPIVGTLIGAGVGGLLGVGAGLLGFGDNEDEVLAQAKLENDILSMGNRQRRSDAYNLDVYNSFYGKGSDGTAGAAYGKRPVYSAFGPVSRKATARVSNGELIGNFEDGYVSRVPGTPNNKDTKLAALRPSDFVISNKFGLSDYAATTGDIEGALNMQDILMKQYKNKYKNGKLPGFKLGLGDYALSTIPHFYQFLDAALQYNTDRNAPVIVPDINADYSGAKQIASQMIGDLESVRPYLDQSFRDYKLALWNMQRNPGLGLGGRLLGSTSLFKSKLAQDAKTRLAVEEANRGQRNAGRQLKANIDSHEVDINNQNAWNRHQAWQQGAGAKYINEKTDRKGMSDAVGGGFADVFKMTQYDRAQDYKERLMGLYENNQKLDWMKFLADHPDNSSSTSTSKPFNLSNYFKYLPNWLLKIALQNVLNDKFDYSKLPDPTKRRAIRTPISNLFDKDQYNINAPLLNSGMFGYNLYNGLQFNPYNIYGSIR